MIHTEGLTKTFDGRIAVDAINLDAGSSTGMYYRGQILMRPLRRLTNLVLVYESREQFEQRKYSILPLHIRR